MNVFRTILISIQRHEICQHVTAGKHLTSQMMPVQLITSLMIMVMMKMVQGLFFQGLSWTQYKFAHIFTKISSNSLKAAAYIFSRSKNIFLSQQTSVRSISSTDRYFFLMFGNLAESASLTILEKFLLHL